MTEIVISYIFMRISSINTNNTKTNHHAYTKNKATTLWINPHNHAPHFFGAALCAVGV